MESSKPYPVDPAYRKPVKQNPSEWDVVKACQYGALGRLVELVEDKESPYDVNKLDDEGVSILHWAAINNHRHIVLYLISKGAIVDRIAGNLMASPLHWAIREGRINMMSLLIRYHADPNIRDKEGMNCLHVAVKDGYVNVIVYLLSLGMDINEKSDKGLTPLMLACIFNHAPDTLRILVHWGVDPTICDSNGNTAAHYAMEQGNYSAIVHLNTLKDISWVKPNLSGIAPYEIRKIAWLADRVKEMAIKKDQLRGQTIKPNKWLKLSRQILWSYGRPAAFSSEGKESLLEEQLSVKISYIMPFVVLFGLALIMQFDILGCLQAFKFYSDSNYFPWWIVPFKIIGIVFVIYCLNNIVSLLYEHDHKNIMLFSTTMAVKALFILLYVMYVMHDTVGLGLNHWLFTISTTIMLVLFYKCVKTDPGYVLPGLQYANPEERNKFLRSIVEKPKDESSVNLNNFNPLKRFCSTCLIMKPLRSKHCSICDKCVAKFDHHCPWIYNCVGQNNHKWFLTYLAMVCVSLVFFLYGSVNYYSHSEVCHFAKSESACEFDQCRTMH